MEQAPRYRIGQKSLSFVLSWMQPICTKRTPIDATSTILFEITPRELILKSTDLEVSLQYSCALAENSARSVQQFLVPGKRIFDLVRELDGDITCIVENNQLQVRAGAAHLALNIKDASEFPPFPERIENLMQCNAAHLGELFDKVSFVIPQNNATPSLNGLLVEIGPEMLTMTATDGHCLAQVSSTRYTLPQAHKWLLPRRAIFELKKILDSIGDQTVFIGICGSQLVFSGDSFNFFTKLLTDQFPPYSAALDRTGFAQGTVVKADLIKTLRRSSCLLSGHFISTQFDFDTDHITASMHNKDVGMLQEELPLVNFAGARLATRFYAPYLLQGLSIFSGDQLNFWLKSSTRPIIFYGQNQDAAVTYLVMPVSATTT